MIERPKWHTTKNQINVGDVVLFLKSEREFDEQYQYGIVVSIHPSKDGVVRKVEVEYQNHTEDVKWTTERGVRDLVIIHSIKDIDLYKKKMYEFN